MMTSALIKWSARLTLVLIGSSVAASCSGVPDASSVSTATGDAAADAASETCAPELAEIDFGIISTESQDNLKTQWEPLLDIMETEIGRPINGFYATDYAGVIEAMGAGKIQLAWYGGKSYIEAAQRSEAEAFAQTVNADGTKGYYSHLITNIANPILDDIDIDAGDGDQYVIANSADLTFAFNDPNSTSGFLVPSFYVFAKHGVNPNEAFEELIFAGSHEATAQAIANNQVDVATNNSESMLKIQQGDPEAFENIQIIWTSPVIPSDPLAYRKDLPDCLKGQIKEFFYSYDDAAVLEPLGWQGFEPAADADWNTIRELNIAKELLEVQNNDNLNPDNKQAKIDELNQQLEALQ